MMLHNQLQSTVSHSHNQLVDDITIHRIVTVIELNDNSMK